MGPGLFSPDDANRTEQGWWQRQIASMGPGLFSPDDAVGRVCFGPGLDRASMGPGLFSPDDSKTVALMNDPLRELQWGRACLARMTPSRLIHRWGIDHEASMGPGLFSPDDQQQNKRPAGGLEASMGPGLFSPDD